MAFEEKSRIVLTAEDRTGRAFRSVKRGLGTLASAAKVPLLAIAAAAVAAGGAMLLLGKRSLESIDIMAKTADKVGIAASALQRYRFAAEEAANVSAGTFDMAMQRFSRRMGEAVQGTGELLPVLQQYGIAMTDAEGRTRGVEDVFRDYADAVAGAESRQEQLRLAFKGFDSEGAALVNLLREGSAGLDKYAESADRLGIVVSRFDASKVEQANDALGRIGKAFEGVGNKIAIAAAPYLKLFADLLVDGLTKTGWLTTAIGWLAENTVKGVAFIVDAWGVVSKMFATLKLGFTAYVATSLEGLAVLERAVLGLANLIPGIEVPETSFLTEWADQWTATLARVRDETIETWTKPLQGDAVRAAFAETRAAMDELAAEAAARNVQFSPGIAPPDVVDEQAAAIEEKVKDHHDRLESGTTGIIGSLRDLWQGGLKDQVGDMKSLLSKTAGLMDSNSKKMFQIGKAAAIAETVVNTHKAAVAAYASLAGIPIIGPALGAAAAFAATAYGLSRIQQIKSQQFGGGGSAGAGAPAGGGGASAPPPPIADVPAQAQIAPAGPARVVFMTVEGEAFSRDWMVDKFIPQLNELVADGAEIRVRR